MASNPTPAAFSRPIMALFLFTFLWNAGTGIALWYWNTQFWRVAHGVSVPAFLIVFGVVWRVHILRGWRLRKNILSGLVTLFVFMALIVTGWTIYYSGSENLQKMMAAWHTWIGFATVVILFLHALLGWRVREKFNENPERTNLEK